MSIKVVLFDVDGVIVISEMFSSQYGKKFNVSSEEMNPFFRNEFQECLVGNKDVLDLLDPWLPKWQWTGTKHEFLEYWFDLENNVDSRILEVVNKLQQYGIQCFVATNQEKHRTKYMRTMMNFESLFDGVFSSVEIGHKKPDEGFYRHILKTLPNQPKPHEILFFDDSIGHVEGAKKVGIQAFHYTDFNDCEQMITPILEENKKF